MQYALRAGVGAKLLLLVSLACAACGSNGSGPASGADAGADSELDSGGAGGKSGAGSRGGAHPSDGGAGPSSSAPPGLWYGGVSLCAFGLTQLLASAERDPLTILPVESLTAVSDVAFDASGNAWVVGTGSDSIFRFSAASLEKPGSAEPDLVISSTALEAPGNLTFDTQDSLWVATRPAIGDLGMVEEGSIMRFDIPDGKSGTLSLSPALQLSSKTAGDFNLIGHLTFDAAQNLWVSSLAGLLRFDDLAQKKGKLALEPSAAIDKTGYTNNIHFYSVAFDSEGALWAASGDGLHYLTSVTEFADPGSLEGRSSPEAAATITGAADVLPAGGIAFDGAGDLWLARANGLVKYSDPGSLSGTVDLEPHITLTVKGEAVPSTNSHLLFVPPSDG